MTPEPTEDRRRNRLALSLDVPRSVLDRMPLEELRRLVLSEVYSQILAIPRRELLAIVAPAQCRNGHLMTLENIQPCDGRCRTCNVERMRQQRRKRAMAQ